MRNIAFLALVAGLVLSVSAAEGAVTVSAPRLTPGDTWTYRTNTSLGGGFVLDGSATVTVRSHTPVEVEGASFEAYLLDISGSGTAAGIFSTPIGSTPATGQWELTGEQIVEAAGMKVVSAVIDLEASGTLQTHPVKLAFQLRVQNTTSYRFLEDAWRFPLDVGNAAVVRSLMNFSEDFRLSDGFRTTSSHESGFAPWNVTHTMEAEVAVDTSAGAFDAFRIRETYGDGTYSLFFYAPSAGNHARTETYNSTSKIATADLVAYRYQVLEPSRFLGLTSDRWTIVAVASGVVVVAGAGWWLRRRRKSEMPKRGPPPTP